MIVFKDTIHGRYDFGMLSDGTNDNMVKPHDLLVLVG